MMKIKTPVAPVDSHQESLATFEEELVRIDAQRQRLTHQVDQHQTELATLAERERARAEQEASAQLAIDNARGAYQEAKLRAELLTTGELAKASLKDLNKLEGQLRAYQDAQMRLLSRAQQEADADDRRRLRLQEDISRDLQTISHLNERQHTAQSLHQKALFEKAEAALQSHLNTVQAMQAQRDHQQAILAKMDNEIGGYVRQAIGELASFPEQQAAFSSHFVFNDALTGLLSAQIDFIDLVLATGRSAELPFEVTQRANVRFQGMAELLAFDAAHFQPALARETAKSPTILIERRDLLTRLLAIYREVKG